LIHSTRNYKKYNIIAVLHSLHFTVTHASTHWCSQSSLVVSWQRISTQELYQYHCNCNTHEVFFAQPNYFLLNHLRVPSQETPSILFQLAWDSRYIAWGRLQQKNLFCQQFLFCYRDVFTSPLHRIETTVLLLFLVYSLPRVFTESLPSSERLL
jgi:hypothetical protein